MPIVSRLISVLQDIAFVTLFYKNKENFPMPMSFSEAMHRGSQLAQHGKIYESKIPYKYNYNLSNNTTNNNSNNQDSHTNPNQDYNYTRQKQSPARLVKSDPLFKMAQQEWSMFTGALVNKCTQLGPHAVKQAIQMVMGIEDRYFFPNEPIGPQRGAYCMEILVNLAREKLAAC
jgi:hypothetical protein